MKNQGTKFIAYTHAGIAFHYVAEFSSLDRAKKFADAQTSKIVVTEHRSFMDSPVVYEN